MPLELRIGDVVRLRKPHPCGSYEWTIVRLGADIGLRCRTCNHRVLLERRVLERRLKAFVSRGEPVNPEIERLVFERNVEEAPTEKHGRGSNAKN